MSFRVVGLPTNSVTWYNYRFAFDTPGLGTTGVDTYTPEVGDIIVDGMFIGNYSDPYWNAFAMADFGITADGVAQGWLTYWHGATDLTSANGLSWSGGVNSSQFYGNEAISSPLQASMLYGGGSYGDYGLYLQCQDDTPIQIWVTQNGSPPSAGGIPSEATEGAANFYLAVVRPTIVEL